MERLLTEESQLKGLTLSKVSMYRIMNSRKFKISLLASSLILAGTINSDVKALGVGVAEADSYIGEHLSVRIPLFNVIDPSSLSVNFQSEQFDGIGQAKINATLDRSN